jgi:hypothetical protein
MMHDTDLPPYCPLRTLLTGRLGQPTPAVDDCVDPGESCLHRFDAAGNPCTTQGRCLRVVASERKAPLLG